MLSRVYSRPHVVHRVQDQLNAMECMEIAVDALNGRTRTFGRQHLRQWDACLSGCSGFSTSCNTFACEHPQ